MAIRDIDSDRMTIHVRQAMGRKDWMVPLLPNLLRIATQHWLIAWYPKTAPTPFELHSGVWLQVVEV
ncbi:MAG: hypothetical protein GY944_21195 [bacterium]|nr:hypothetical protein [bacterium]